MEKARSCCTAARRGRWALRALLTRNAMMTPALVSCAEVKCTRKVIGIYQGTMQCGDIATASASEWNGMRATLAWVRRNHIASDPMISTIWL